MIQSVLVQKAINAATNSEWQVAIDINEKILEQFPDDLDSLNRLARACFELGDLNRSKKIYKEVLNHDPYNVIALKNLKRFQALRGNPDGISHTIAKSNRPSKQLTNFIEEPGKTKVIQLVRVAEPHILLTLHCGDFVLLQLKQRGIHACTESDVYIGRMPDDIAFQLQFYIKSGNKYEAYIKQVQSNGILLFVRETYRTPEFASRPTFSYIADTSPVELPADSEASLDSADDDSPSDEQL